MREGRTSVRTSGTAIACSTIDSICSSMSPLDSRCTRRNEEAGAWLSIQPTYTNGLSLSKDEWRDGV